jgi:hypothetical protein
MQTVNEACINISGTQLKTFSEALRCPVNTALNKDAKQLEKC